MVYKVTPKVRKLKVTEYQRAGKHPIVDQGQQDIAGYTDDEDASIREPLPLVAFGDHTKSVKYVEHPFVLGADGVVLLSGNQNIDLRFLFYWLKNVNLRNLGYARHFGILKKQHIPLPPLPEQKRIAAILKGQMAATEKARTAAQARLEAIKSLPAAFLRQTFPQPDQSIPEGWRWAKLGEVCKTATGGTPSRNVESFYEGDIPWVKSGELNDSRVSETKETITRLGVDRSNAKIFPEGTLLIALYGATVGKLGILGINAATNQAVCAIFPSNSIDRDYLFCFLLYRRKDLIDASFGGAQPNISQSIVRSLNIPIPPLPEQKRTAAILKDQMAAVEKARTAAEEELTTINALPAALLRRAFNGEI